MYASGYYLFGIWFWYFLFVVVAGFGLGYFFVLSLFCFGVLCLGFFFPWYVYREKKHTTYLVLPIPIHSSETHNLVWWILPIFFTPLEWYKLETSCIFGSELESWNNSKNITEGDTVSRREQETIHMHPQNPWRFCGCIWSPNVTFNALLSSVVVNIVETISIRKSSTRRYLKEGKRKGRKKGPGLLPLKWVNKCKIEAYPAFRSQFYATVTISECWFWFIHTGQENISCSPIPMWTEKTKQTKTTTQPTSIVIFAVSSAFFTQIKNKKYISEEPY